MKASVLIQKLREIERNHKTLYVMGCFGAPLTGGNVTRYCQNHDYNKRAKRTAMIKAAANKTPPVFGFDCVNLIKGVLWGWSGDASKTYGGASYKSNGVPDIGADGMIKVCKDVSTDFRTIIPGEAVWLSGHIGVYVGGGVVLECSPAFKNCVQETACLNIGPIAGMNGRKWTKHGKIPYVTYDVAAEKPSTGGTGTAGRPGTSGGTVNTSGASAPSALYKRKRGQREAMQAGTGEGNADCEGGQTPLPAYPGDRRRFHGLRMGGRGGHCHGRGSGNFEAGRAGGYQLPGLLGAGCQFRQGPVFGPSV